MSVYEAVPLLNENIVPLKYTNPQSPGLYNVCKFLLSTSLVTSRCLRIRSTETLIFSTLPISMPSLSAVFQQSERCNRFAPRVKKTVSKNNKKTQLLFM